MRKKRKRLRVRSQSNCDITSAAPSLVISSPDEDSQLRSDNGAEFTAHAVRDWLTRVGVRTLYIEPGSPWDIMVPVVSAKTGLMYCAHKVDGNYQYVGLDWKTGELKERWIFPDESRLWNAFGGITTIFDNGDLLIGGAFGIRSI